MVKLDLTLNEQFLSVANDCWPDATIDNREKLFIIPSPTLSLFLSLVKWVFFILPYLNMNVIKIIEWRIGDGWSEFIVLNMVEVYSHWLSEQASQSSYKSYIFRGSSIMSSFLSICPLFPILLNKIENFSKLSRFQREKVGRLVQKLLLTLMIN